MHATIATRAIRHAFVWALLIALALFGLAMMERTSVSSGPAVSTPVFELSAKESKTNSNGNHERHCSDGKGSDAQQNPHCQGISQE